MNNLDLTDWFMMLFTAALLVSGTVYLFEYHSPTVFGLWCGLLTIQGGVFHGLRVYDQKNKDCPNER